MKFPRSAKIAALVFIFSTAQAADLNGCWMDNISGKYYIKQIESEVWWLAEQSPLYKQGFTNVAHGKISGKTLILSWSDIPKGIPDNSGVLVLTVSSDKQTMKVLRQVGGYGPSQWGQTLN